MIEDEVVKIGQAVESIGLLATVFSLMILFLRQWLAEKDARILDLKTELLEWKRRANDCDDELSRLQDRTETRIAMQNSPLPHRAIVPRAE